MARARVARARVREAHPLRMPLLEARAVQVAQGARARSWMLPPERAARRPCPRVPSARTTPNVLSASVWMVFAAIADAAVNAKPAPKPAVLERARRSRPAILVARGRYAPARASARGSVTGPVLRPARCRATLRCARPRAAQSAVNTRPSRFAMAVELAPARPRRPARPVRVRLTTAESASGPVRLLLAPQVNTVRLRASARRRKATELEIRARRGPSAHRLTVHRSTAFAAIPTARDNARTAATARARARESPRASRLVAVPHVRAQPTPPVAGVATTPPTIAIFRPREPHARRRLAQIRRTSSPRPAPGVEVLALVPALLRSPVRTAAATERVRHALPTALANAAAPMDARAPALPRAQRDRPAGPSIQMCAAASQAPMRAMVVNVEQRLTDAAVRFHAARAALAAAIGAAPREGNALVLAWY